MSVRYYGAIVNTRGYKGSVLVTDIPENAPVLAPGMKVEVGYSKNFTEPMTIAKINSQKMKSVVDFEEISTKEQAAKLREKGIFYNEEDLPEQPEEKEYYYVGELEDVMVYNIDTGEPIGEIIDVWLLPANDVWIVRTEKGDLPVPVIDEVVINIDLGNKRAEIKVIPGLLDLRNDSEGSADE